MSARGASHRICHVSTYLVGFTFGYDLLPGDTGDTSEGRTVCRRPTRANQGLKPLMMRFRAVLEGLRATLPGIQVLFAFLLTLPLLAAFEGLATPAKAAYLIAFFESATASVLLIAPSEHQRVRVPRTGVPRRNSDHLHYAVKMTIAGTVAFSLALKASVFLVTYLVLTVLADALAAGLVAMVVSWAWFYVPIVTFAQNG